MAGLLFLQFQQIKDIEASVRLRADSITALTFQMEREFLRLRQAVAVSMKTPLTERDAEALRLRFEIFVSRVLLLQDNPSIILIENREEYRQLKPPLTALVKLGDDIFAQDPPQWGRMSEFLAQMDTLGPQAQALSFASNAVMSQLIETKQHTISDQYDTIVKLTVAQLVLLVLVAVSLWVRNTRLVRERVALEELADDLREAHHRAEAANQGKTRFLANMSHELRTPFNGMLGMLSLLEGSKLDEQQQDHVRTAKDSAQHLLTLLNDVLDVSAMEAGRLKLEPQATRLPQLLLEVEHLMRGQAQTKGLSLQIDVLPGLPEWVQADPTRLKQILFNLLSNGIKFTKQGFVRLRVESVEQGHLVANVRFVIEDSGIGMDEKAAAQLFQRFYQAESDTRRRFGGTGLGLEISRSLARMMGGELEGSSQLGVGSTFSLVLPLPLVEHPPAAVGASVSGAAAPTPAPEPQDMLRGRRVLVAEDHPVNQKLVAALLKNLGCEGVFCENGQLAVHAIHQQSFDLVLMDIHMPVMDGLEATRQIRQKYPDPVALPIIAISADVMNDAKENALTAGINEFLPKPVRLPELKAFMTRLLMQKQMVT
jgi:signal transduction histidine kinase/ActR/RegA family two-component response regulator